MGASTKMLLTIELKWGGWNNDAKHLAFSMTYDKKVPNLQVHTVTVRPPYNDG